MRNIFLSLILLFALCKTSGAQTSSVAIMDALLKLSSTTDVLKIYLTDSQGINSATIKIGSVSDSTDILSATYNINSLPAGSSFNNNVLIINLGSLSSSTDYFVDAKISLTNNEEREIQIHSSN